MSLSGNSLVDINIHCSSFPGILVAEVFLFVPFLSFFSSCGLSRGHSPRGVDTTRRISATRGLRTYINHNDGQIIIIVMGHNILYTYVAEIQPLPVRRRAIPCANIVFPALVAFRNRFASETPPPLETASIIALQSRQLTGMRQESILSAHSQLHWSDQLS
ncbi:hypothetical protein GGS23DRAFT_438874 [Durotheca rogersii]|uniref:uncharacterized protein n=1 Tax=Durotheca rogersii TaxID=419775 RepID=UPI0022200A86|nr:uncharacterized protein GGS23DRAFT_438874 [Durotheca rogersii]KAI5856162.1 hypothetical protein GGS23DRAFT_438874 [Durotheca rogersii]